MNCMNPKGIRTEMDNASSICIEIKEKLNVKGCVKREKITH